MDARESRAGAILFVLVLLAVAVGGYLWLTSRRERLEAAAARAPGVTEVRPADKWTRRLGRFLERGPSPGTWETRFLSCVYTHYIAAFPDHPDVVIIARVGAQGAQRPRAVARWLVPRFFFRAPAHLFFANYARSEGPIQEDLEDGTRCWRVHWASRRDAESLTERIVWFTQIGGQVVQVEDRSRSGHLVRRVRRVAKDTGVWNPEDINPADLPHLEPSPPDPARDPDDTLATLARKAPFAVYAPAWLPPGFVLVRANYSVRDAALNPAVEPGDAQAARDTPVHLLSQLYSDGLALISVGVAPRRDMDLIETLTSDLSDEDDPTGCPGLPSDPKTLHDAGHVIRMRSDLCRTVLRRDHLGGSSVTIIGRNELATEDYLRMMSSLRRLPSASDR
jgi:hypothetical protein